MCGTKSFFEVASSHIYSCTSNHDVKKKIYIYTKNAFNNVKALTTMSTDCSACYRICAARDITFSAFSRTFCQYFFV